MSLTLDKNANSEVFARMDTHVGHTYNHCVAPASEREESVRLYLGRQRRRRVAGCQREHGR